MSLPGSLSAKVAAPSACSRGLARGRGSAPTPRRRTVVDPDSPPAMSDELAVTLYEHMVLSRASTSASWLCRSDGVIAGHSSALGEEAASLGAVAAMRRDYWVFPGSRAASSPPPSGAGCRSPPTRTTIGDLARRRATVATAPDPPFLEGGTRRQRLAARRHAHRARRRRRVGRAHPLEAVAALVYFGRGAGEHGADFTRGSTSPASRGPRSSPPLPAATASPPAPPPPGRRRAHGFAIKAVAYGLRGVKVDGTRRRRRPLRRPRGPAARGRRPRRHPRRGAWSRPPEERRPDHIGPHARRHLEARGASRTPPARPVLGTEVAVDVARALADAASAEPPGAQDDRSTTCTHAELPWHLREQRRHPLKPRADDADEHGAGASPAFSATRCGGTTTSSSWARTSARSAASSASRRASGTSSGTTGWSTRRSAKAASSAPPSAWRSTASSPCRRSSSPTSSTPRTTRSSASWRSSGGARAAIFLKMVVRTPVGGGIRGGLYHSQSPESLFIHVAGLKVVCPSNPHDAKGLLLASIRDPDPVLFFEPKRIYRAAKGEVPEGDYTVPIGQAAVLRPGKDVTVLAWGAMLYEAIAAADEAKKQGIGVRGDRPTHALAGGHRHHRRQRGEDGSASSSSTRRPGRAASGRSSSPSSTRRTSSTCRRPRRASAATTRRSRPPTRRSISLSRTASCRRSSRPRATSHLDRRARWPAGNSSFRTSARA